MDPKLLKPGRIALRPVRRESLEYYQLRESIQSSGVLTPLLVRGNEIVDGHSRRECALDLDLPEVPVHDVPLSDWDVLLTQVRLNPTARNDEYVSRVYRILRYEPDLTLAQLVHYLGMTQDWLVRLLNLSNVEDQVALYAGTLPVALAIEAAKLPKEQQKEIFQLFSGGDLTTAAQRDILVVEARRHRQSQKDARTARKHEVRDQLKPRYRSFREVCHELDTPTAAASVLHKCGASDVTSWLAAIQWVLSVDPETLEARQKVLTRQLTTETGD